MCRLDEKSFRIDLSVGSGGVYLIDNSFRDFVNPVLTKRLID